MKRKQLLYGGIVTISICCILIFIHLFQKDKRDIKHIFENKELEVAVFSGGLGAKQWEEITKLFQEKYPEIKIELLISSKVGEILLPRVIAGDTPDFIVMMDENYSGLMEKMIKNHLLLDITDLFYEPCIGEEILLKDKIMPGYLESRKYVPYDDGKIYIAPQDCGPRGLIYNKELFRRKGWKVPETWEEFFALGDEAKKEDRYLFTYPGIYPKYLSNMLIPAIANAAGYETIEKIFNYEKGSFSDQKVIEVLRQFEKIQTGDYLLPYTLTFNHTQAQEKVMIGEALFIPTGPWVEQEMLGANRESGFEFGMAAAPAFEKNVKTYIMANYGQACIPLKAKNKEVAREFLKFLYTDKIVEIYAENANSVMAVEHGPDLAKPFITKDLYEMFELMKVTEPILSDFAVGSATSETRVKEALYMDGMTALFGNQITANELAQRMESVFAQIREETSLYE